MARVVNNSKDFRILEVSRMELMYRMARFGTAGVCDVCMDTPETGYYVAVLNEWICRDCLEEFLRGAVHYEDDRDIEERNFRFYCKIFGVDPDL